MGGRFLTNVVILTTSATRGINRNSIKGIKNRTLPIVVINTGITSSNTNKKTTDQTKFKYKMILVNFDIKANFRISNKLPTEGCVKSQICQILKIL